MKRVVIFASGTGTNAENLIRFFQNSEDVKVILVLTNNPHAKVLDRCKHLNVSALSFNTFAFSETNIVLDILLGLNIDLIILAGFLWKIPKSFIKKYQKKIINIHPALLPKYGGKGMYGKYVHEAVVSNNETETGITIHYVNAFYDQGAIIFQAKTELNPNDTPEIVAKKVHQLEIKHFPIIVQSLLQT